MTAPTPDVTSCRGWFKSTFSNASQTCVEVRFDGDLVHIRDSKYRRNPANDLTYEPIITVTVHQWATFLKVLAPSTAASTGVLRADVTDVDTALHGEPGTTLRYTATEWQMFIAGVDAGEFDHAWLAPANSG